MTSLRNTSLITALGLIFSVSAYAETMYVYKDANGATLLTNVDQPTGGFESYNREIDKKHYKAVDNNDYRYTNYSNDYNNNAYNNTNYDYYDTNSSYNNSSYNNSSYSNANYNASTNYTKTKASSRGSKSNRYDHLIRAAAKRHGVDPALVKAIIHTESNFKPRARSHVGAQGLMQLMPGTARELRVRNPWNPAQNIEGGTRYIAKLLKRFNNNKTLALAGYNAGPNRKSLRNGRVPNIRETKKYVKRVLGRYNRLYRDDPSLSSDYSNNDSGFQRVSYATTDNYNSNDSYYINSSF